MSWEAKAHRAAKQRVRRWLIAAAKAERWGLRPGDRVRTEMPIGVGVKLWHADPRLARLARTPSTVELVRLGFAVPFRLDISVTRMGAVVLGVEIVNLFEVAAKKAAVLRRLPFPTVELDARWVNLQRKAPADWSGGVLNVYGG